MIHNTHDAHPGRSSQEWSVDAKGCVTLKAKPEVHLTVKPRTSKKETEQKVALETKKDKGSKERQDQIFNLIILASLNKV